MVKTVHKNTENEKIRLKSEKALDKVGKKEYNTSITFWMWRDHTESEVGVVKQIITMSGRFYYYRHTGYLCIRDL